MNQFTERYKTISNSDLLKIITNPTDYQTLAVDAAKQECTNRQLSDTEITNAKAELETQQKEKETRNEKKKIFEENIKIFGSEVVETFNPIQTKSLTTSKIIKIISIVFLFHFVYVFFSSLAGVISPASL